MAELVTLSIDGKKFEHWSKVKLTLSMDSYSTLEFSAPFEATRKDFRETFRPFAFRKIEVSVANETMFHGWMVGVHPEVTPEARQVKVTGYALPAVFNDVTAPASALPMEFNKMTLRQIAEAIVALFDVRLYFPDEDGAVFEKATLKKDQKIHAFLSDLAQHRSFVVTNTLDGSLLIWKSIQPGTEASALSRVARLKDREQPCTGVEASFSPQEYFSSITGFARAKHGRPGSAYTTANPWLPNVLRPLSFVLDDIEKGDAPEATRAKLGRMFGNMASYSVDLATWRDANGQIWAPNTTVTLDAPDAMVYRETEFLVRTVTLEQDANSESASLGLVLPGAFSGQVPEALPWDEA